MTVNGPKWPKMGQKWPKMAQKWPKNDISISGGPAWDQKRTQNEKKLPKKTLCGPKWPEIGQKWAKNDSKWPKKGPKKSPGAKSRKNCSPLSSIFDIDAPFQRYLRKSKILPILADSHLRRASTLIFQKISMKLGQIDRVTKKMTLTYNGGEP